MKGNEMKHAFKPTFGNYRYLMKYTTDMSTSTLRYNDRKCLIHCFSIGFETSFKVN